MGFGSGKKPTLQQGWFESSRALSERCIRAGNAISGEQFANAKRTLRQMDEKKAKEEARRRRQDEEARLSRRSLAQARSAKKAQQAKRNMLNGWWS